jgi:hypothetical protein
VTTAFFKQSISNPLKFVLEQALFQARMILLFDPLKLLVITLWNFKANVGQTLCHCEGRSPEAISFGGLLEIASLTLATT